LKVTIASKLILDRLHLEVFAALNRLERLQRLPDHLGSRPVPWDYSDTIGLR